MQPLIQYDLFQETTDDDVQRAEIVALKDSLRGTQKKAFSEIRVLTKIVLDLQNEIDYLKVKMGLACSIEKRLEPLKIDVKKKRGRKSGVINLEKSA